jgi:hypothetical protein
MATKSQFALHLTIRQRRPGLKERKRRCEVPPKQMQLTEGQLDSLLLLVGLRRCFHVLNHVVRFSQMMSARLINWGRPGFAVVVVVVAPAIWVLDQQADQRPN